METVARLKEWIREQAPMLTVLYENKYLGMAYDRFASLPPKQQRKIILGGIFGVAGFVFFYLLFSYLSLWSVTRATDEAGSMTNMLLQYQKQRRDKGPQIRALERNNALAGSGALKQQLQDMARNSGISPRMVQVTEQADAAASSEEGKSSGGTEVRMKQGNLALQKITLSQLVALMKSIEFGSYNLSITSLRIANDEQVRGYMNVDVGVVAYLVTAEEG